MSWIMEVLVAVDRLGNAIAGGNSLSTVSARVGYYSQYKVNRFWAILEWIINTTFEPIDGKNHCRRAMRDHESYRRGNDVGLSVLSILIILACIVIWPVARIIAYYNRKVLPYFNKRQGRLKYLKLLVLAFAIFVLAKIFWPY